MVALPYSDADKQFRRAILQVEKPDDIFKDPYVLEFTGLPEEAVYTETELKKRLIDNLQMFLLELGRGFTFVGRQVRFTFEEEHYRVDLVILIAC